MEVLGLGTEHGREYINGTYIMLGDMIMKWNDL
jgi:hypothetical protein